MKSTLEQQRFNRIIRLIFLLGTLVGIWVMLISIRAYNFILRPMLFFDWPLGPFQIALNGVIFVLYGKVTDLRSQFLTYLQKANSPDASRWALERFNRRIFRGLGFFFICLGMFLFISKLLKFPDPVLSTIQQISVVVLLGIILLVILGICWYFYLRDKRRVVQRAKEEQGLHENEIV